MLTGEDCRHGSGCSAGQTMPSCDRGGRHRKHGRVGDAAEGGGVIAVQPNACERAELGDTIQEE